MNNIESVLPALPAYPPRPPIIWQTCGNKVALSNDEAIQLRDWLLEERNWAEAVTEIWSLQNVPERKN